MSSQYSETAKVLYLLRRYPTLSQTFVLDEILALERLGLMSALQSLLGEVVLAELLRQPHDCSIVILWRSRTIESGRWPSNNGIEQTNGDPHEDDAVRSASRRYLDGLSS